MSEIKIKDSIPQSRHGSRNFYIFLPDPRRVPEKIPDILLRSGR